MTRPRSGRAKTEHPRRVDLDAIRARSSRDEKEIHAAPSPIRRWVEANHDRGHLLAEVDRLRAALEDEKTWRRAAESEVNPLRAAGDGLLNAMAHCRSCQECCEGPCCGECTSDNAISRWVDLRAPK